MRRLTRSLTAALLAVPLAAAPAAVTILSSAPAAQAEVHPPPGTDLKPVLGWSSWSFFRSTDDAAIIEAAARAMHNSGLEGLGSRVARFLRTGWTCSACGKEAMPSDKFCTKCGTAITPTRHDAARPSPRAS